jgi:hypothetical protein
LIFIQYTFKKIKRNNIALTDALKRGKVQFLPKQFSSAATSSNAARENIRHYIDTSSGRTMMWMSTFVVVTALAAVATVAADTPIGVPFQLIPCGAKFPLSEIVLVHSNGTNDGETP